MNFNSFRDFAPRISKSISSVLTIAESEVDGRSNPNGTINRFSTAAETSPPAYSRFYVLLFLIRTSAFARSLLLASSSSRLPAAPWRFFHALFFTSRDPRASHASSCSFLFQYENTARGTAAMTLQTSFTNLRLATTAYQARVSPARSLDPILHATFRRRTARIHRDERDADSNGVITKLTRRRR